MLGFKLSIHQVQRWKIHASNLTGVLFIDPYRVLTTFFFFLSFSLFFLHTLHEMASCKYIDQVHGFCNKKYEKRKHFSFILEHKQKSES